MDTLKAPTPGRSRFSKALPAPPPELSIPSSLDSLSVTRKSPVGLPVSPRPQGLPVSPLPRKGVSSNLPSPFPPRKDSASIKSMPKSPDAELPALPSEASVGKTQFQTNSIPRRPVGQTSKTMKRVSSITSILSAYSASSPADSVNRSSNTSAATKDSTYLASPEHYADIIHSEYSTPVSSYPPEPKNEKPLQPASALLPYSVLLDDPDMALPPPPPLKDLSEPQSPRVPEKDVLSSPNSLTDGMPQRRELWRRRASTKSDRSLAVSELKLPGSHGSTAGTSQLSGAATSQPATTPQHSVQNKPAQLPKSRNALPGRNIKPDVTRELPRLNMESAVQTVTSPVRDLPPTPDSETAGDDQRQLLETIRSPASPASSPELGPRDAPGPIQRKPVAAPTPAPAPAPPRKTLADLQSSQSANKPLPPRTSSKNPQGVPNLLSPSTSRDVLRPLEATTAPTPVRSPQPQKPEARAVLNDIRSPISPSETPAQAIAQAEYAKTVAKSLPQQSPVKPQADISHHRELNDVSEAPENMSQEQWEKLEAALKLFPRNYENIPSEDVFVQPKPIGHTHMNCYTNHNKFVMVKNNNHPLACQTCEAQSRDQRWMCSWCNLRICPRCMDLFQMNKKDLGVLVDLLEKENKMALAAQGMQQTAA